MADRRTQRIREQLRQHPNPRAGLPSAPPPLVEHMRRVYGTSSAHSADTNPHTQLAQRLDARRKGSR